MNKKNNDYSKLKKLLATVLVYAELVFMVIIVVYPTLWIIGSSFNPINGASAGKVIPDNATLDNYRRLFTKYKYISWYKNTLYVACLTTVLSVAIGSVTSYVFARLKFRGKKIALLTIIILQMFPSFLSLTALYLLCLNFGILNNLYALVLIYAAGSIPNNIWLVRGYLMNIPKSLDEAAFIDGASKWQVFTKIIFPLASPMIAFMALNAFMSPWMDYLLPRYLINRNELKTLAVGIFDFIKNTATSPDFTAFAAGSVLVAFPITIIYMVFQKYLIQGLTSGANKGE